MSKLITTTLLGYFLTKIKGIFVGAATDTTEGNVVTFGADGKTVTDSGFTIGVSVPSDAVFTDTTYTAATAEADGLMSKEDKAALDAIDLSQYALKSDIASVFTYKGTVATYAELPAEGQVVGDVYNITGADDVNNINAGDNVVWNGTEWDNLSGIVVNETVTIEEATTADIDALFNV